MRARDGAGPWHCTSTAPRTSANFFLILSILTYYTFSDSKWGGAIRSGEAFCHYNLLLLRNVKSSTTKQKY